VPRRIAVKVEPGCHRPHLTYRFDLPIMLVEFDAWEGRRQRLGTRTRPSSVPIHGRQYRPCDARPGAPVGAERALHLAHVVKISPHRLTTLTPTRA
jgi:hypothetical protein